MADYLGRARRAGPGCRCPTGWTTAPLEGRLFSSAALPPTHARPLPAWPLVHRELRRPGVTLQLLWMEYESP